MAYPFANLVKAAVEVLYSVIAEDKTKAGARSAAQSLNELRTFLNRQYPITLSIASGNDTYAGISEMIAGEADADQGVAFIKSDATVAFDVTDGKFLTAKGTALAAGDLFVFSGADDVVYLGNNANADALDFSGETSQDFTSYGA